MTRRVMMVLAAAAVCAAAGAEVIEQSFDDGDAARWEAVSGEWAVEDGAFVQTDASSPDYRFAVFDSQLTEGSIEVTATPLERNRNGNVGASFGLVVKYLDDGRWCAARFGSYGSCSLLIRGPGAKGRVTFGHFEPEPGQDYRVRVILRDGMIAISREGLVIAILEDPFPDAPGRPGLFTETRCRFDDVRIEREGE
ncbi:MAG: hypothetical protein U9R79_17970 [Armatimonadota bacterium]|nr:hypothetical protein [Armatimonadota bacterium]